MVVQGPEKKNLDMTKKETADGLNWSVDVSFDTIGQYTYFFVLYAGTSVKIYCDDDGYYGEGKVTDLTDLQAYDLIVYKAGFKTSEWMKNAVIYQIFPDRFYNADTSNDQAQKFARGTEYEFIKDWDTIPENPEQEELNPDSYPSNAFRGDGVWGNEIYGGDLKGITERIGYLKALGVNVIYLNPVFASISNHRYDASDYSKIDPILGDLGDFQELVKVAKENGMHIILDGVFNHVADDSIYFDRYYRYLGQDGTVGAYPYWAYVYDYMSDNNADKDTAIAAAKTYFKDNYNVTDFSYTEWFKVEQTYMDGDVKDSIGLRAGKPVYAYDCWWGYDNMPVIYSTNGSEYQTGNWGEKIIGDTANNKDASD
ncbi:MAG TPA: glycosidase, partial [Lachnospiraceae bacterium]|nr:glycosidase [Lachnospiraceae bacterium]